MILVPVFVVDMIFSLIFLSLNHLWCESLFNFASLVRSVWLFCFWKSSCFFPVLPLIWVQSYLIFKSVLQFIHHFFFVNSHIFPKSYLIKIELILSLKTFRFHFGFSRSINYLYLKIRIELLHCFFFRRKLKKINFFKRFPPNFVGTLRKQNCL